MIRKLIGDDTKVYLACGPTDFRKQIDSLIMLVSDKFNLNAYESGAMFIFCNKKKNSIKILCYDRNGFLLAQKKLLSKYEGKFKWPKDSEEAMEISNQQVNWLLQGLGVNQKKAFKDRVLEEKNIVF